MYKFWHYFVKFIPKCFILLDAIVDGFFLISLSHSFWQSCVVYVCHNPSGVINKSSLDAHLGSNIWLFADIVTVSVSVRWIPVRRCAEPKSIQILESSVKFKMNIHSLFIILQLIFQTSSSGLYRKMFQALLVDLIYLLKIMICWKKFMLLEYCLY